MSALLHTLLRRVVVMAPADGEASGGGGGDTGEGINSVADAVAEMDRRAAERRAAKKAEKAAAAGAGDASDGDAPDDPDDEDHDPRRVDKKAKAEPKKGEKADPKDKAPKAEASDADEESDDDGDADGDDESDSSDDAETTDDDADADDSDEGKKPAAAALDDSTEIEIDEPDGTKRKVSLKELRQGYQRQADFTRWTQERAQTQAQFQQAGQALVQQGQQLQQAQQHMIQFAQAMLGPEPDPNLAFTDPGAYTGQRAAYDQRVRALQTIVGQAQQTQAQQQQLQAQGFQRYQHEQVQALVKAAPELRDPAKLQAITQDAAAMGQRYGFTPADMTGLNDHRMVLILRDLAAFHRAAERQQQATKSVKQKLANVPPRQVKAGPGTAPSNGQDGRRAEAKKAFAKSARSMKDVRAYLARTS